MHIDSKGWDNLQTRHIPEKVFVETINDPSFHIGGNYEYSETAPSHFDIDDVIGGRNSRSNFITLFYCLPEIFAPVNEIASRVADAVWQLRKDWNDEIDYKDQAFNKLFSQPNPLMSHKQLVWQSVCYELLTGANFQAFNKPSTLLDDYRNILTWSNLPTPKVIIDKKKGVDPYTATELSDFVNSYQLKEGNDNRTFTPETVLPLLNLDLECGNDISRYKSHLHGAKLAIKNLLPVYEARGVIFIKRGALGFLVSKKSDASGNISLLKTEKEEAQRDFQNTYGLTGHKNTVGVSAAPLEYIQTGMSIQELQPFDETLADAVAIYKVLRVPRHLVPSKDHSTYANADADMKSFYNDVIEPMAKRYAQAWTSYFKIDRRYIHPDFSHISVLQENRKEKADVDKTVGATYLQRFTNGVATLNDWIVVNDGEKSSDPLYNKKIFEMEPDELERVKNALNLKSNGVAKPESTKGDQGVSSDQ